MTDEERRLLVSISKWMRRNGWTRCKDSPGWEYVAPDYETIIVTEYGKVDEFYVRWNKHAWPIPTNATVAQTLDILCAFGVLPWQFSPGAKSGWRTA